jgi:hypothetical protein
VTAERVDEDATLAESSPWPPLHPAAGRACLGRGELLPHDSGVHGSVRDLPARRGGRHHRIRARERDVVGNRKRRCCIGNRTLVLVNEYGVFIYDGKTRAKITGVTTRDDAASGFYEVTALSHVGPAVAFWRP